MYALESLTLAFVVVMPSSTTLMEWSGGYSYCNDVGDLSLPLEPVIWLLDLVEGMVTARYTRLFLFYSAFYAHREIILCWKSLTPPTVSGWKLANNSTLPLYKLTYASRTAHTSSIRGG